MWLRNLTLPFQSPEYIFLTLGVMWLVFSVAVWLANIQLILSVFASDLFPFAFKMTFPFTLYASFGTNFSVFSAITTLVITVLVGLQVSLLTHYIRSRQTTKTGGMTAGATSISGIVTGFFGIGCAACGPLLITSLFSLVGAAGLLALLPLRGQEFGLVGIGLLVFSIYLLSKKLSEPMVCDVR